MRKLGILATGFAGALVVGACGGGDGTGSGNTDINANEAAVIGDVAASQISGMASGLTTFGLNGGSIGGGFFAPAALGGRMFQAMMVKAPSAAHRAAFQAFSRADGCEPIGSDSTDSDGDGIADNDLWTWDCNVLDSLSGTRYTVTGSILVHDPVDVANGFGYDLTFTNFRFASTIDTGQGGSSTFETVVNGTYGADVLTDGAVAEQDVVWVLRLDGQRIFRSAWDWAVSFTPSAGTIDWVAEDMPAGAFTINGGYSFSGEAGQESGDWSFTINSTAPLVYDGACLLEPPFGSGVIEGAINGNGSVGFTITYTGCGAAEVIAAFNDNA